MTAVARLKPLVPLPARLVVRRGRGALRRRYAAFARLYGRYRLRQPSFQAGRSRTVLRGLDAELLAGIGSEHRDLGRLGEAVRAFDRATALTPGNERIQRLGLQARGDLAVLAGEWQAPDLSRLHDVEPVEGRVLHVVGRSLPHESGYTLRTRSILRCQRTVGLDPHVATDESFPQYVPGALASGEEILDGTVHHRIDGGDALRAGTAQRLDARIVLGADVVDRVRPAVLHAASDFLNAEAALAWGQRFQLPVVYEVRGFWAETWLSGKRGPNAEQSDFYVGRRARELECMKAADAVVTLGEAMRDEIVEQGIDERSVVVVPNAVDAERFTAGARDPRLAKRLGIEPGDVVVGYVTSITAYEGIPYLLRAIAVLARAGRPVRAVIVGDGPLRPALLAMSQDLGVADRVRFTGWVPHTEIVEHYRLLDVFVVPRTNARVCQLVTPLKPYEAMAMGCPVVAADLPALAEMVDHGRTGLLFRAGSPGSLAEALDSLITDAAHRERLGAAARTWVAEHRTWEQNGRRYLDLYRSLGAA